MPNPMIRIHDLATGEIIDREMTDAEFAKLEEENAQRSEVLAKEAEKEATRQALLNRLGITEEEAKLLLS